MTRSVESLLAAAPSRPLEREDLVVRIATRKSPLAMWQAEQIADHLRRCDRRITVSFVSMDTTADQRLDISISELGGKGAFSSEVQQLVMAGHADIAVHSAKDLQAQTPDSLRLVAYPQRGDVRDILIGSSVADLPVGAVVATGSNRRRTQLQRLRPDLRFRGLRGNIGTRLAQLGDGIDAIIMAAAAIERLEVQGLTVEYLEPEVMIPQVGQGALAVECRSDDPAMIDFIGQIDHPEIRSELEVERSFLRELGGNCTMPAGAHAWHDETGALQLRAMLCSPDERMLSRVELAAADWPEPGVEAARRLRQTVG